MVVLRRRYGLSIFPRLNRTKVISSAFPTPLYFCNLVHVHVPSLTPESANLKAFQIHESITLTPKLKNCTFPDIEHFTTSSHYADFVVSIISYT